MMATASSEPRLVSAGRLEGFVAEAFRAAGLPDGDARSVAELMTRIDLRGLDGHGVFRLPQYIQRIRAGGINVNPDIRVARETDATALIDGDNAVGHLAVRKAVEVAMEKAARRGVAWAGTNNSNHAGAASIYAMMPLARDMIGLYVAVGSANHLPPWGGIEMLLSTNPLACAVPGLDEPPVVLDMATTTASYGKVKMAAQRGETMPEGWMIDREGRPLTDAARAEDGFLLPIGGYKGYGLALIFGLLAGTLNGAAMGRDVIDFNKDDTTLTNTGQLIIALDIKAFADVETFKRNVDAVIRTMRDSPTMPGVDAIRVPGEQSDRIAKQRMRDGIPIPPALLANLGALAGELGIAPLS
jgi:LDH2 family malate/lactate/ureidoglycolate dehydrogenase